MAKEAISVSLEERNLLWLRGRTRAGVARSVSQLLDQIIEEARQGRGNPRATSVVGTLEIAADDPDLREADPVVRAAFDASLFAKPARTRSKRRRPLRG